MSETDTLHEIMRELGRGDTRAFRNSCGVLQDKDGRYIRFGLFAGSGDLIGWRTVMVTPEMVGLRFAVFMSVEVKSKRGKLAAHQEQWRAAVAKAGGIAIVARSAEQAREGVDRWTPSE